MTLAHTYQTKCRATAAKNKSKSKGVEKVQTRRQAGNVVEFDGDSKIPWSETASNLQFLPLVPVLFQFRVAISKSLIIAIQAYNFTVSTNISHMKLLLPLVFSFSLLFSHAIFSSTGGGLSSGIVPSDHQLTRVGTRSLKSVSLSEDSSELVALLNGTVYFEDKTSGKVIWSFSTGGPIYSSYQADLYQDEENLWAGAGAGPSSGFYVDYGDDWQLYAHGRHSSGMKLSMSIEEFIKITPHIWEDGAVILGSKKTTVFVVDVNTGRLVITYKSCDSSFASQSDNERTNSKDILKSADKSSATQVIYVTRTDYSLQTFGANSDKILWNMNVGMIEAAFLCKEVENPMEGLNLSNELGSESDRDFYLPSPCQSRRMVVRRQDKPEFSSGAIDGEDKLPLPAPKLTRPSECEDGESLDNRREIMMLPESAPNTALPVQTGDTLSNVHPNNDGGEIFDLPKVSKVVDMHDAGLPHKDVFDMFFNWSTALPLILFFVFIRLGYECYHQVVAGNEDFTSNGQYNSVKASPSKKNKSKKSGKHNGSVETKERDISSQNQDGYAHNENDNQELWDLNKHADGDAHGRRIGKLFVSSHKEIAKGSNGTIVLEGIYEGRQVAVKRLVQAHHDVAFKEIQNLIASDRHPNIVRWYGVEYDKDFVYLSLERCTCSLDDLIQIYSGSCVNPVLHIDQASRAAIDYKLRLNSVKGIMKDLTLWKANGHPSSLLLMLMRDVVSGLVHLHELGIIHRDLKPQNVLIIKERSLCAKLSDMGISRRLLGDMSSLGRHATGCGSSGWQSPEQLLHGRQTRAVDLFSLGCVLFFCITGGRHPFGDPLERDINVVKNRMDLFLLEFIPEAEDLISRLLRPDPEQRPKALEVLHHPLFWNSEMRLSFLRDTSDRVELEDREPRSNLLDALERIGPTALGGKWNEKMEAAFIHNIGHYRRYKFDSVRDLLRVMRNKLNHYRELPKEIQELVGPVPEGYDGYFATRFPKLLMEVYKVVCRYCREEECFLKYFEGIP